MESIPFHVYQHIVELFSDDYKKLIEKYFREDVSTNENGCFDSFLKEVLLNHFSIKLFDASEIRNKTLRKLQMNKKNWLKTLKKSVDDGKPNPIETEIKLFKQLIDANKDSTDKLLEFLPVKDLSELYSYRFKELDKWSKDKEQLLSDYPYLDQLKEFQVKKGLETDAVYLISNYFSKNKYDGDWSKLIKPRPYGLITIPWAESPHTIKTNVKQEGDDMLLYNDYSVGENTLIRSMFAVRPNERLYYRKTYALDDLDSDIIEHVLEHRGKSFYTEAKSVTIDLRALGRELYKSDGGKILELVKQRIGKIARYSQEFIVLDKETNTPNTEYIINIFQEAVFDEKKQLAHVVFSDRIHQNIIKNQTVQVYSDITKQLENPVSKTLIYALQKERIECYSENKSYSMKLDYYYFTQNIRFRTKKIHNNFNVIEGVLKEFQDKGIIVKEYQRLDDGFIVEFIPLSEEEERNYFNN